MMMLLLMMMLMMMKYSPLPWGEGRLRPSLESDLIATIAIIAITPIIATIDMNPIIVTIAIIASTRPCR